MKLCRISFTIRRLENSVQNEGKIGPWWNICALVLPNNVVINTLSNHWFDLMEDED